VSKFPRRKLDYYPTPREAVLPLAPHLPRGFRFVEPCAGDGRLIGHLTAIGLKCVGSCDSEPKRRDIEQRDAFSLTGDDIPRGAMFITNPPHLWSILRKMIVHFSDLAPTWLLVHADLVHNLGFIPFLPRLRVTASIGRVRWVPGTRDHSTKNFIWAKFDRPGDLPYISHGRIPKEK
jgi:hypothetical protein